MAQTKSFISNQNSSDNDRSDGQNTPRCVNTETADNLFSPASHPLYSTTTEKILSSHIPIPISSAPKILPEFTINSASIKFYKILNCYEMLFIPKYLFKEEPEIHRP